MWGGLTPTPLHRVVSCVVSFHPHQLLLQSGTMWPFSYFHSLPQRLWPHLEYVACVHAVAAFSAPSRLTLLNVELIPLPTPVIVSSERKSKAIEVMSELGCRANAALNCISSYFLDFPSFDRRQPVSSLSLWGFFSQKLSPVYKAQVFMFNVRNWSGGCRSAAEDYWSRRRPVTLSVS